MSNTQKTLPWSKTYRRFQYGPNDAARLYAERKAEECGLSGSARYVYIVMASWMDEGGGNLYRSRENLGACCGCSCSALTRGLKVLRDEGLIVVERLVRVNGFVPIKVYGLPPGWLDQPVGSSVG